MKWRRRFWVWLAWLGACFGDVAVALPASNPAPAQLYAQPHEHGQASLNLAPNTLIEVKTCTGGSFGWCAVTVQRQQGWMPRRQLNARGNCAALRAVGLGDLRRSEASYQRQRDRNGDGIGCDWQGN